MGRIPCCEKDNVKRGQWTPEEDNKLSSYIAQHGTRNWRLIPKNAGLSLSSRSCYHSLTCFLIPHTSSVLMSYQLEFDLLFILPKNKRSPKMWEELPAALDQLPSAWPQAWPVHRRRRANHSQASLHCWQQVHHFGFLFRCPHYSSKCCHFI